MKHTLSFKTLTVLLFTGILNLPLALSQKKKNDDNLLASLMAQKPEAFKEVLAGNNDLNVQIIYTQIDRQKKNKLKFTDYYFGIDSNKYFYPASTVKLPVAILALQKLNELNIPGLDMNSTMITGAGGSRQTEVGNDPSSPDGRPTIAHYIKKILLVSDNDAFNRLYEFLGQEYINQCLHTMGYREAQIIHRLEISLTEEENRHTNPVTFYDSSGRVLYTKPAEKRYLVFAERDTKLGKGFMRNGELVNEPFDFSKKNRIALTSLHTIIKSIMFPDAVEKQYRFNLKPGDYEFLRRYMSMMPHESTWPRYTEKEAWDTYVKFLYYGSEKGTAEPHIRIFNKVGDAYGFLIDAAYFADYKNNKEFILSAVIHCNSDGIYNDDKYEYNSIGFPFMKNLGRLIAEYEMKRPRKNKVSLSPFVVSYTN